jgi:hypothetical protein
LLRPNIRDTLISMETSSDASKRAKTLQERGLDLEVDGAEMFWSRVATVPDKRFDYGEDRSVKRRLPARWWSDSARRQAPRHFNEVWI